MLNAQVNLVDMKRRALRSVSFWSSLDRSKDRKHGPLQYLWQKSDWFLVPSDRSSAVPLCCFFCSWGKVLNKQVVLHMSLALISAMSQNSSSMEPSHFELSRRPQYREWNSCCSSMNWAMGATFLHLSCAIEQKAGYLAFVPDCTGKGNLRTGKSATGVLRSRFLQTKLILEANLRYDQSWFHVQQAAVWYRSTKRSGHIYKKAPQALMANLGSLKRLRSYSPPPSWAIPT